MRAVTATGVKDLAELPLVTLDLDSYQAQVQPNAVLELARSLSRPMRIRSVAVALILALLSLEWAPWAVVAVAYCAWRLVRRAYKTRTLAAEIEMHLIRQLGMEWPTIQRSVRSFQISGNSTTSSILRR